MLYTCNVCRQSVGRMDVVHLQCVQAVSRPHGCSNIAQQTRATTFLRKYSLNQFGVASHIRVASYYWCNQWYFYTPPLVGVYTPPVERRHPTPNSVKSFRFLKCFRCKFALFACLHHPKHLPIPQFQIPRNNPALGVCGFDCSILLATVGNLHGCHSDMFNIVYDYCMIPAFLSNH